MDREGRLGADITWRCKCECGGEITVRACNLKNNTTKSCGCNRRNPKKHGLCDTRLYSIHQSMKTRCNYPAANRYHIYGGRGIKICDEWEKEFKSFYDWALANGYNKNLTLDRINVNGNYEPSNCRWATAKEQGNNTRFNHLLTYKGETHNISEWSEITGLSRMCIQLRINRRNWSTEKTLTTPNMRTKNV